MRDGAENQGVARASSAVCAAAVRVKVWLKGGGPTKARTGQPMFERGKQYVKKGPWMLDPAQMQNSVFQDLTLLLDGQINGLWSHPDDPAAIQQRRPPPGRMRP